MARRQCVPAVVDEPDDRRRSTVERQLLSLLAGFERLHRLSQAEMCEVLVDCVDWLACPNYASRIYLPAYDVPIPCPAPEEEERS